MPVNIAHACINWLSTIKMIVTILICTLKTPCKLTELEGIVSNMAWNFIIKVPVLFLHELRRRKDANIWRHCHLCSTFYCEKRELKKIEPNSDFPLEPEL